MKSKKGAAIISVILVMILSLGSVSYAAEDNKQGPVLSSISMSSNDITAGDTVDFIFEAHDENTGIRSVNMTWTLEGSDGEGNNSLFISVEPSYSEDYTIDSRTYSGKWLINQVEIFNTNNVSTVYTRSENSELIGNLDFTFKSNSDSSDKEAPVLNNITVSGTDKKAPCEVTIEADISDNKSETVNAQVNYATVLPQKPNYEEDISASSPTGVDVSAQLNKEEDGKYRGTVTIDNKYIKLLCISVLLEDENGNFVNYTNHVDLLKEIYGESNNYVELGENIDLQSSDYEEDNEGPELVSFENNKDKIYTPGTLITKIDLEDKASGIPSWLCGTAYYKNENGDYSNIASVERAIDNNGSYLDYYNAKLDIDRYTDPGEIYIDKIVVNDLAGNVKTYSVSDGTLDKKPVEIVSDIKEYTLQTSTIKEGYIDEISILGDGSTVLCDISSNQVIPKKLFEVIKDKDITITFENIYGQDYDKQGIQWIVNGKDIVKETKDVDMSVNVELDQECKWILDDYEFEEVIYDETLPEEEAIEKARIQQRRIVTEYFNFMKSKGYEDTDKYLEKTLDEINSSNTEVTSAIMEATDYSDYLRLDFADNGTLPGKMIIRIKPDYAARNIIGAQGLYLFYVEDNKTPDKIDDKISLEEDEYYEIEIDHNSEYWLANSDVNNLMAPVMSSGGGDNTGNTGGDTDGTGSDVSKDQNAGGENTSNKTDNAAKTGDMMNVPILIGIMALAAIVGIYLIVAKKEKRSR